MLKSENQLSVTDPKYYRTYPAMEYMVKNSLSVYLGSEIPLRTNKNDDILVELTIYIFHFKNDSKINCVE